MYMYFMVKRFSPFMLKTFYKAFFTRKVMAPWDTTIEHITYMWVWPIIHGPVCLPYISYRLWWICVVSIILRERLIKSRERHIILREWLIKLSKRVIILRARHNYLEDFEASNDVVLTVLKWWKFCSRSAIWQQYDLLTN